MEISADRPMPESSPKYTWHRMKPGDSVRIEFEPEGTEIAFRKAVANAFQYQARMRKAGHKGYQMKSKTYPAETHGIVWRVA